MDAISGASLIPSTTYVKVQITLNTVAAVFVAVRITTNRLTAGRFFLDDYMSVVALIFLVSYSTSSSLMTKAFVTSSTTIETITKISVACLFTGGSAMYFSKTPLLLLYIRLFYVKRWLRFSCYFILVATAIVYLVCAAFSGSHCIPSDGDYDLEFQSDCMNNTFPTALARCFTSIFSDLLILSLPLPVIMALNLPTPRKTGLAVVFLTGVFAITAACTSLYYQWNMMETGSPSDMTIAMLCTCLECCIAIIVGCAPALHALWSNYLIKTGFVKSLKTMSSFQTQQSSSTTSYPRIQVTTHRYLELENLNKGTPNYHAHVTSDGASQQ
jgi:hypothetical protein